MYTFVALHSVSQLFANFEMVKYGWAAAVLFESIMQKYSTPKFEKYELI